MLLGFHSSKYQAAPAATATATRAVIRSRIGIPSLSNLPVFPY